MRLALPWRSGNKKSVALPVEETYPGAICRHYGLQTRTLQFLYKPINDSHRPAIPVENTTHSRPPTTNLGLIPTEGG